MIEALKDNPVLLLFLVIAVGYPLGQIKIRGLGLGVAAVLFAGIAVGGIHPDLKLPEVVYLLGLSLFVYSVGLASGRDFIAALKRKGVRDNLLVAGVLLFAALSTIVMARVLGIKSELAAGTFAGALTNTPALAAVLETIKQQASARALEQLLSTAVVGYTVTYPLGVVGALLTYAFLTKAYRADFASEAREAGVPAGDGVEIIGNRTVRVTRPEVAGVPLGKIIEDSGFRGVCSRWQRGSELEIPDQYTVLDLGDRLMLVGKSQELEALTNLLGEVTDERLDLDRSELDYRRIFVSNQDVVGKTLSELNLQKRFGAIITRVRRGDGDMLPEPNLMLELGDRVRVLADRERLTEVTRFFGDSYRDVSEIDILTFALGLTLGLALGAIPIPLTDTFHVKLGFAGGPLVVALVLGAVARTGRLVWTIPYSANMTLRQLGVVLFLAGIGTRSGYSFLSTMREGGALLTLSLGAALTVMSSFLLVFLGRKLFRIPFSVLGGMLAAQQTQPAVLGFALEHTRNELPNTGYATVYPTVLVLKIVLAQLILQFA